MKQLKKSLTVSTIAVCSIGWFTFYNKAIDELKNTPKHESYELENLSIANKIKKGNESIHKEYERLVEEERKRLEELERQRLERLEKIRLAKIEEAKRIEQQKKLSEQKKIEEERKKKEQQIQVSRGNESYNSNWITSELTHFQAYCKEGCNGISASGIDISKSIYYKGYRIVAVPPNIPLFSILEVVYPDGNSFKAIALDRGGAISHSGILDVLVESDSVAYKLGRQKGKYRVIGKLK